MKISIMGLGYVGAVSAGCLASEGHEIVGVDPQQAKVDLINAGRSPIIEKDLGDIGRPGRQDLELSSQEGGQRGENVRLIVNDQDRAVHRAHRGLPSHTLHREFLAVAPDGRTTC